VDEWFTSFGVFYNAYPNSPAMALSMALDGPPPDQVGYGLAYSMHKTQAEIDLYPPEEMNFEGLG
jgi:hypothetical protein